MTNWNPDFTAHQNLELALTELQSRRNGWRWWIDGHLIRGRSRSDSRKECVVTLAEVAGILEGNMPKHGAKK